MPLPEKNPNVYTETTITVEPYKQGLFKQSASNKNLTIATLICVMASTLTLAMLIAETFGHEHSKVEIDPTGTVKRSFEQDGTSRFFRNPTTKMAQICLVGVGLASLLWIALETGKSLCNKPYTLIPNELESDTLTKVTSTTPSLQS